MSEVVAKECPVKEASATKMGTLVFILFFWVLLHGGSETFTWIDFNTFENLYTSTGFAHWKAWRRQSLFVR